MMSEADAIRDVKRLRRELRAAEERLEAIQEHAKARAVYEAAQAHVAALEPVKEPAAEEPAPTETTEPAA